MKKHIIIRKLNENINGEDPLASKEAGGEERKLSREEENLIYKLSIRFKINKDALRQLFLSLPNAKEEVMKNPHKYLGPLINWKIPLVSKRGKKKKLSPEDEKLVYILSLIYQLDINDVMQFFLSTPKAREKVMKNPGKYLDPIRDKYYHKPYGYVDYPDDYYLYESVFYKGDPNDTKNRRGAISAFLLDLHDRLKNTYVFAIEIPNNKGSKKILVSSKKLNKLFYAAEKFFIDHPTEAFGLPRPIYNLFRDIIREYNAPFLPIDIDSVEELKRFPGFKEL